MAYNGSGTFVVNSSGQPVVTGTVISSTAFNALTADLATGLSTAITKDGQTTTTVRVPFAQGISSTLVTDATSATTGSIITAGGISTQKALWVGTTATVAGATTLAATTATSLTVSGTTTLSGGANIANLGGANKIINGDMVIDQRNAGATVVGAFTSYVVDRFYYTASQASKVTLGQNYGAVTPPGGFSNYFGSKVTSTVTIGATDFFLLAQRIEGLNCGDLNWGAAAAKAVTLSFWAYSSATGTFGGSVSNSAANRSYPFQYSIPVANTWTSVSVTIPGDTSGTWLTTNGVGLVVYWSLGSGSTYSGTVNTWSGSTLLSATGSANLMATSNATLYITGVKLEVGSIATPFAPDNYTDSLLKCQRYYQKWTSTINQYIASGSAISTNSAAAAFKFLVSMRTNPVVTVPSVVGTAAGQITFLDKTGAAPATLGTVSASGLELYGFYFFCTGYTAAFTAGDGVQVFLANTAVITSDAEL